MMLTARHSMMLAALASALLAAGGSSAQTASHTLAPPKPAPAARKPAAPPAKSGAPAPSAAANTGAGAAPTEAADLAYILGPDDVVEVDALGHADFQTRARVGNDGKIQLPYVGSVPAENMTVIELGQKVSDALEKGGYFSKPIVKVEVVNFASRNVTVLGEVSAPGVVPVGRAYRLSEILARVGSIKESGADYVIVRPAKGAVKKLFMKDFATGELSGDPFVSPGDTIFVPKAELFYVSGQVKGPGAFPYLSDMTLRQALARGGGITDLGSLGRIKVTRNGQVVKVPLEGKIQPGDVIDVGERLF